MRRNVFRHDGTGTDNGTFADFREKYSGNLEKRA